MSARPLPHLLHIFTPFPQCLFPREGFLVLGSPPQAQLSLTPFPAHALSLCSHRLMLFISRTDVVYCLPWPSCNVNSTRRELCLHFCCCILSAWGRVGGSWWKALVVGRTMAPKHVQVLMSETCDNAALPGLLPLGLCWYDYIRGFEMGKLAWIIWINIIMRDHRGEGAGGQSQRRRCNEGSRGWMMQLLEGSMSQGMWAAPQSWERQGNGFFSRGSRRSTDLAPYFRLLTSRTIRK